MRNLMLAAGALSLLAPVSMALPTAKAEAKSYSYKDDQRRSRYREWRGRDGRTYCKKSNGTTGLVVGGIGGALVGRTIDTRGDRTGGTVLGAVAGALAGREIDRANSNNRRRCR
ncbi:glycine zipper 2TM domain-containing protein [Sphingomonas sp. IC-56]|uniref:glycine zipper 2TM domain-containing protein n=1 Tax=Sphingomonas sp. IC-56 TaxID=2898529 RepID=UPI001E5EACA4|nr:glycine zipper 2TM domain-containing protein [Sphingomonas sp. IC-56]MCD2324774.1 glycine zipper 2TM domain-containing protein [Sphingomonas sp. IC-56]